MSMIAMAQPIPHSAFKREFAWDESRHSDYASSRRLSDNERIALPPIRQAVPELQLRILPQEPAAKTHSSAGSPVGGFSGSSLPTPDYVHSPNQSKRRRLSTGEEREERVSQVPRLYTSPHREREYMPSSRGMSPTMSLRSVTESWASPSRTSPFIPQNAAFPPMRETPVEATERMGPRPMLPRLPTMDFGREPAPMPRIRGRSSDEGYGENLRHSMNRHPADTAPPNYRSGSYYSYHHPSRVQSLSCGSVQLYERSPFSPAGYPPYPEYMRVNELGGMGPHGDNKQRKRRGNLPKETTDKLRSWFLGHLNHPYPTEDEKQKLMQQTGLQMNQISNWFINARRRQLPAMINNARAESNAMSSARSTDGKVLASTETADYEMGGTSSGGKRSSLPLSDGEGSPFDDDLESLKRRHTAGMSRGSV
ncbi:hypothetical protein OQA88_138 [Cercophora sp. LCS_1]